MELIAFVLVVLAFIVALFVGIAVLATLGALLVRVFGKQIWRWPWKNGADDLRKAHDCIGRLLKEVGE